MRLSASELRRQKEKRLQQIEDSLFLILFGYGVFVFVGCGVGKLVVHMEHQHHLVAMSDFTILSGFTLLAATFAGSIVWEPVKKLFYTRAVLKADLSSNS